MGLYYRASPKHTMNLKNHKNIILCLIFILSILLSFALGYLSAEQKNHAPIIIENITE